MQACQLFGSHSHTALNLSVPAGTGVPTGESSAPSTDSSWEPPCGWRDVQEGACRAAGWSQTYPLSETRLRLQKDEDPFSVRVLPRILWGVHPRGLDSMPTSHPSMVVMHHFLGSWKIRSPWDLLRWSVQKQLVLQLSHLLQRLYAPALSSVTRPVAKHPGRLQVVHSCRRRARLSSASC